MHVVLRKLPNFLKISLLFSSFLYVIFYFSYLLRDVIIYINLIRKRNANILISIFQRCFDLLLRSIKFHIFQYSFLIEYWTNSPNDDIIITLYMCIVIQLGERFSTNIANVKIAIDRISITFSFFSSNKYIFMKILF